MSKEQITSFVKKLTSGVLAIGMIVTGITMYPNQAVAAVVEDKVIYQEYQANEIQEKYWNANKKIAPIKEGYVFGGWFEEVDEPTSKTETYVGDNQHDIYYNPLTEVTGNAYAKFVPAQVLSVKAQNQKGVTAQSISSYFC